MPAQGGKLAYFSTSQNRLLQLIDYYKLSVTTDIILLTLQRSSK
jgi:hypothetical protein